MVIGVVLPCSLYLLVVHILMIEAVMTMHMVSLLTLAIPITIALLAEMMIIAEPLLMIVTMTTDGLQAVEADPMIPTDLMVGVQKLRTVTLTGMLLTQIVVVTQIVVTGQVIRVAHAHVHVPLATLLTVLLARPAIVLPHVTVVRLAMPCEAVVPCLRAGEAHPEVEALQGRATMRRLIPPAAINLELAIKPC